MNTVLSALSASVACSASPEARLDRIRLSGQKSRIHEETTRLQHPRIGRNDVPALSRTSSPGTMSLKDCSLSVANDTRLGRNRRLQALGGCPARPCWTKSSVTPITTIAVMMRKLVTSPVSPEIVLAARRRRAERRGQYSGGVTPRLQHRSRPPWHQEWVRIASTAGTMERTSIVSRRPFVVVEGRPQPGRELDEVRVVP
jgi:hypothetical protein